MVLLTMVLTKYALIHSFEDSFLTNRGFIFLSLLVLLITSSGYIINDVFDIKTDSINKPNKVVIDKYISKKNALNIYYSLTFIAIVFSIIYSIKFIEYLIFLGSQLLLYMYSVKSKKTLLLGNFIISLLACLPIYIVFVIDYLPIKTGVPTFDKPILNFIYAYIIFAFLTTLIREIIKDIEDINGDLKVKAKTLPIVIGRKRASKVAFFFTCILLIFLLMVLQFFINEYIFLGYGIFFILLPLLYFMYKLWFAETKKDFSKLSSLMKVIMLFGILSMLLFKFI